MTAVTSYPLARVGKSGERDHILDPNGRCRCENHWGWNWRTQDQHGGYSDSTLVSKVKPLGRSGMPTCDYCLGLIS